MQRSTDLKTRTTVRCFATRSTDHPKHRTRMRAEGLPRTPRGLLGAFARKVIDLEDAAGVPALES